MPGGGGGGGTKRIRAARVICLSVLYTDRHMPTTHSSRSKTLNAYAKRFQQLKADLAQIEYFSKGTLLARMVRCGMGLPPKLRQLVKTQNPLNGELSHGVVTKAVHQRV